MVGNTYKNEIPVRCTFCIWGIIYASNIISALPPLSLWFLIFGIHRWNLFFVFLVLFTKPINSRARLLLPAKIGPD